MSFEYYVDWWIKAKQAEIDLLNFDTEFRHAKRQPLEGRSVTNALLGGLYVKYLLIVQDLDICLDQMIQPQKRATVKKLIDAANIRLMELHEQMKKIHLSEYVNVDGTLVEQKILPQRIEILHSSLIFPRPVNIHEIYKKYKRSEKIWEKPPESPRESLQDPGVPLADGEVKAPIETTETGTEETKKDRGKEEEKKNEEEKKAPKKRSVMRVKKAAVEEKILTPEEQAQEEKKRVTTAAIKMIQTMERARADRIYFSENEAVHAQKVKLRLAPQVGGGEKVVPVDLEMLENAAIDIQRMWRGHADRRYLKRKEDERRILIGMNELSWYTDEPFKIIKRNLEKRRELRDQRARDYEQAIIDEKNRLLRVMAPGLFEDITDEIRAWFHYWYDQIRIFDKYPPEKVGGSVVVIRMETFTPKEYLDDYEIRRRAKVKGRKTDKQKEKDKIKKAKELEKMNKKKEADRKKKEIIQKKKKFEKKLKTGLFEYEVDEETNAYKIFNEGDVEYKKFWDIRNDYDNPEQVHYMDIINDDHCLDIQMQVRADVDELMRIELDLLNESREQDIIRMTGKKKKGKKKKGGKKGKGKGKGKKGKGKKDMTGDRSIDDLFQELVDNEIIRTYPDVELKEFHGDRSYKREDFLRMDIFEDPGLLEVRQALVMNCVIPMGIGVYKRLKSLLILGPPKSGKHILANAIFNMTQCVLFDLSPEKLAGKYQDKDGMKMLLHLINKMSRLLAPSILFIDGAERIFYKKVPKEEEEMDPKRIGTKLFSGILKTLKPEDRVMALGITSRPWLAGGKMKKAFEKTILIPKPEYNSVYMFWRELLMRYHGVDRDFNASCLAKMTVNYSFATLKYVMEKLMTPKRIIQLSYNPLTPQEIYEVFLQEELQPINDKEYKKMAKYSSKNQLSKYYNWYKKAVDKKRMKERPKK